MLATVMLAAVMLATVMQVTEMLKLNLLYLFKIVKMELPEDCFCGKIGIVGNSYIRSLFYVWKPW